MTQEQTSTTGNGAGWLGVALSLGAIVVSVIALIQGCSANALSREANDISVKNVQLAETQLAVASMPSLQASYYPGESIALDTAGDRAFIESFGLSPTLIKSAYWRTASTITATNQPAYLFILISNYGPGTATQLSISGDWISDEGAVPPSGLFDLEGPAPLLPPGRFFALLVDVIDSYDPAETLANQTATHFQLLRLLVTYNDSTGMPGFLEINAPDLPPAFIVPGF
jgi:hypothetical protein